MSTRHWLDGERIYISIHDATAAAQQRADANGAPVAVMGLGCYDVYAIIEEPPDEAEGDPCGHGWDVYALIAPCDESEAAS